MSYILWHLHPEDHSLLWSEGMLLAFLGLIALLFINILVALVAGVVYFVLFASLLDYWLTSPFKRLRQVLQIDDFLRKSH